MSISSSGGSQTTTRPSRQPTVLARKALKMGLTGLAFSGGGIRSATFALGILQGLARLNLLSRFDYLSTVSGGGYIGSWLAAWVKHERNLANVERQLKPHRCEQATAERVLLQPRRRIEAMQERAPADHQPDAAYFGRGRVVEEEPEPINHIRSYSNYLAPRPGVGSADTWALRDLRAQLRDQHVHHSPGDHHPGGPHPPGCLVLYPVAAALRLALSDQLRRALLSLLVSVAYIVVVLNEVSRSRDTSANRDGRGSETTPPLRYTKKWLRVLVIFPLFLLGHLLRLDVCHRPEGRSRRRYQATCL